MDMMRLCCGLGVLGVVSFAGVLLATARSESDAPTPGDQLPEPRTKGPLSLEAALARRRSVRRYGPKPLTDEQVGQLCWAAQGVTEPETGKRTAPSAGALYPLELDVVTAEGVRRYLPGRHALSGRLEGDVRGRLAAAALHQRWVEHAPAVLVISAVAERTERKYGDRAERYVSLEAGHAAQNVLLQAEALGLGAVPVGAFDDAKVAQVLALQDGEAPVYLIPVGRPAEKDDSAGS